MIKATFDEACEKAKNFKYSSMHYIDYDECKNAQVLHNTDDLILIHDTNKSPAMLYFAANDFETLVKLIADIPGQLRMHFVPREYAGKLKDIGFTEWAEFLDFWNTDIAKTASQFTAAASDAHKAEYLDSVEYAKAATVAKKCTLQSRGFEGTMLNLTEGQVIACRIDSEIAGFCNVSIYNEGTTLWVRVLAVDPAYQGRGIGKVLMEQAIKYGVQNGAVKGFLHADKLNDNAIGLYNKFDFHAKDTEGELVMVKENG